MKMTFAFGRFNPSTIGHEVLIDKAKSVGGRNYRIYISQSQDRKKNPLDYSTKLHYMRKMFPKHAKHIINSPVRTAIDVAVELSKEGFTDIMFIAGSDRVKEFDTLLQKYNGVKARHGEYKFDSIKVISAGERDPDADGASGMSASKMRAAAEDDDFDKFYQGLPPKFADSPDAKKLFRAVQKAMGVKGLNEHIEELDEAVITLAVVGTAILTFAGKVAVDMVAPHAALALTIWWMLPVGLGLATKLAIAVNVAAWALPSFLAALGAGASIKVALKNSQKKVQQKVDGMTAKEMKKLPAKTSDKKLIAKTISDKKFKAAIREELMKNEKIEHEGFFGRTLKKKSYAAAVQWYKKFIQRGDKPMVALHKAAGMIQGLNDKDFQMYLRKMKLL